MNARTGQLVVQEGTTIQGDIRNCLHLDVAGTVHGDVAADDVVVHPGGRLIGSLRAGSVEVLGTLEGDALVRGLLKIGSTGSVTGDVRYGQLAIEPGGNLVADVRNIPPRLAGDHTIEVPRGGTGPVTAADLQAIDPDDPAHDLVFTVLRPTRGFVAKASASEEPIETFTQADIDNGAIVFTHDGSAPMIASFDVVCADASGATSGAPQTIRVNVQG